MTIDPKSVKAVPAYFRNIKSRGRTTRLVEKVTGKVVFEGMGVCTKADLIRGHEANRELIAKLICNQGMSELNSIANANSSDPILANFEAGVRDGIRKASDARLIAELVEACETALEFLRVIDEGNSHSAVTLEAAIAKATQNQRNTGSR